MPKRQTSGQMMSLEMDILNVPEISSVLVLERKDNSY
jgi:hypothetical protein